MVPEPDGWVDEARFWEWEEKESPVLELANGRLGRGAEALAEGEV